jgi:hypothetical protein
MRFSIFTEKFNSKHFFKGKNRFRTKRDPIRIQTDKLD